MKIKKSSWHYKLISFFGTPPKSAILYYLLPILLVVMVSEILIKLFIDPFVTIIFMALVFICLWLIEFFAKLTICIANKSTDVFNFLMTLKITFIDENVSS